MTGHGRKNVLLVVFDSLGAADVERHAADLPTLSALQCSSIVFAKAYACSPESSPARASLFTGLDMAAHGLWTNGVALPKRETTLSEVFGQQGYRTCLVGRRHLAGVSNWTTENPRSGEFDHIDWAHGPLHRSPQNGYLLWLRATAPDRYAAIFPRQPNPDDTDIAPEHRAAMAALPNDLSFNTWVAAQVCKHLKERGNDAPFLGIASMVVGDTMGAKPNGNTCEEALSTRALRQADTGLAGILDAVPDNTIVVVTSARGTRKAGQPMADSAIRVPLLIHGPGIAACEVTKPVSAMDIAPTLYDAAGVTRPQRLQGQNLLSAPPRGWAFSRLRNPDMPHQTALVTDRWKLVMAHDPDKGMTKPAFHLYDLHADPGETTDLAQDPTRSSDLDHMIDLMIDARVALEDRTEPRVAKF